MEEINQNENKSSQLLQDSYSIDNESIPDSNDAYNIGNKFAPGSSLSVASVDDLTHQRHQLLIDFIQAVKDDNTQFVKEICSLSEENKNLLNLKGLDDFYPIQYAVLFGNINMIDTLLELGAVANYNTNNNLRLEGLPILHLSLSFAAFAAYRKRSIDCFLYLISHKSILPSWLNDTNIYSNYVDRLGRTLLHLIFQYDLHECLYGMVNKRETREVVNMDNLKIKDFNGESVFDYVYIYNSTNCFKFLCESGIGKTMNSALFIYKHLSSRSEDESSNNSDSNGKGIVGVSFVEQCVLYNSIDVILVLLTHSFKSKELKDILTHDITNLTVREGNDENEQNSNENENDLKIKNIKTQEDIYQLLLKELENIPVSETSTNTNTDTNTNANANTIDPSFRQSIKNNQKTLISYHLSSFKHGEIKETNLLRRIKRRESQVENPDRLSVLLEPPFGILLSDFYMENFVFRESTVPACLADILRVHDYDYIESIKKICEEFKSMNKLSIYKYDRDTYINHHTWESAIYSAGCVIETVDKVMGGEFNNAMCLVRPPGHHSGYFGRVDGNSFLNNLDKQYYSSNGFCFLNNVAIGAAYCKYKYRDQGVKKIAIVDFDVHHGNGTEELVRLLTKQNLAFKNDNNICSVTINKKMCRPWVDFNDAKDVLFVSVHGYDEENPAMFYPSSGGDETNTLKDSEIYPGGVLNVPITKGIKFSHCYRNSFRAKVTPRLIKFQPDIIFISAGFDGHENELINSSYMRLNEFDYRWITEEVMRLAKVYCNARVISVLEGGYNINTGIASSFAQSVMTHSRFLNTCLNKRLEKCKILSKAKRKREFTRDLENYRIAKKFKTSSYTNEDDVEVFDKSRLRNGRKISTNIEQDMKNIDQIDTSEPEKPKLGITPPITPYINYSKSLNELSMNDLQKIPMDNDNDSIGNGNEEMANYTGNFDNFITNQNNQLYDTEDENAKYIKVEPLQEVENKYPEPETIKVQNDNPDEEFEVVMDEEEEIPDIKNNN